MLSTVCLKGHLCAVGECGRPVQRGKCLDCGSPIGGEKYRPEPGFIATQTRDRSQTGHILGSPSRRGDPEGLDTRDMSPVPFTLLRMLTHMAMLLGVAAEPQSVAQIIRPPIPDPGVFLMGHLLKDLEQLSRALRKGTDDTVSAIHLVIRSLLESQPSRQARRSWEASIADDVITPRLKDLDQRLKEVNASLRGDLRVACNPVVRVVFGDPCLFLSSLPKDSLIHRGAVWSCRERVSLPNLAHILEQNHGKDAFPLLWTFLQKEAELRLVKSLPDIVALQKELVRRFQNGTDLSAGSIEDFIQSQTEGSALVSYLIALHNHLIYAMEKHMGEENSYTVGVSDLTDMHMIGYEPERDLIPLVLSSCQHSLERGQETLSQYDLPRVQQLGMPTLVSRQERDYESLLMDVKGKVSQAFSDVCEAVGVAEVVLSFLAATGGEAHMDLVPYLEQVLQMGDQVAPHILKVSPARSETTPIWEGLRGIGGALSSCSLKHCVALWQFLSSLKSESMLRLKRDPFVGISGQYRQHLGEEAQRQLSGFCSRGSVEALLEMHQFMLLHLKHNCDPLMYRPDWGLKETLQSYLERKDVDTLPDIEEFFPEDILLSQAVETWKFIVVFRQRWNPR
ncbi:hypothetical protein JZ751_007509 [Albula glossodonta]|uniref:RZ-type domain-containing protein n=1 Tax=Albula glossodonta TaxID=121402 RepID=A0A8T2N336_9TELE|nr:hypothetical protein JZ751_007509 [Albula glossodonta]